jgi:C-terminal processing protease CtpA/Prc
MIKHLVGNIILYFSFVCNLSFSAYQPESIADSSSSEISSRHCTLERSNSYNGFGIYVSTDMETRREHFIRQVEDLSPGEQAGLKENDRILCINGTPVINEDYTVVLQLIKHGLQTDTLDFDVITNDAYQQFKSQIDQLYQ